jgi:hypothetical protein
VKKVKVLKHCLLRKLRKEQRNISKALLSAGHDASAMCSQTTHTEITSDCVKVYNVIHLTRHAVNETTGKKVIVIIDFELVSAVPNHSSALRRRLARTSAHVMSVSAFTLHMTTAGRIQAKIVQKTQSRLRIRRFAARNAVDEGTHNGRYGDSRQESGRTG